MEIEILSSRLMSSLKEKLEFISGIRAGNLWGQKLIINCTFFVEKLKGNANLNTSESIENVLFPQ